MIYWELFLGFLKVGCFAFGGAYAAIPLIREVVLSYGWLDEEAISYMIAVSESTPGPIMINLATYIGSSQAGLPGAILATLTVSLPAFVIILLVVSILDKLLTNKYVQATVDGLKPAVIGIVLATGAYMLLNNCMPVAENYAINAKSTVIALVLITILLGSRHLLKKKLSPIMLILISACLGIAAYGV